jgi:hypothetical protein
VHKPFLVIRRFLSAERRFRDCAQPHPSYPAAHAYNGGACAAILKAFFNGDFVVPNPVQATEDGGGLEAWAGEPLTLGQHPCRRT